MVKKITGILSGCLLLIFLGVFQLFGEPFDRLLGILFSPADNEKTLLNEDTRLKTTRVIPQNVNWGAFLSGKIAQQNKDFLSTQKYMQQVLKTDPQNPQLQELVYVVSGMNGDIENMSILAQENDIKQNPQLLSLYVRIANHIKLKEYQQALSLVEEGQGHKKDFIFILLKTWCYAGLNNQQKAFETLLNLNEKEIRSLYLYHHALLNEIFHQEEQAKKDYLQISAKEIPSLNMLLSAKSFFEKRGEWNIFHPLYSVYNDTMKESPTFYDATEQSHARPIQTVQDGFSETFYEISVALYEKKYTDQALIYNNLARYLSDDLVLYKTHGARLYEIMQMYAQANALYDSIGQDLDIVKFKKAFNFIAIKDFPKALELLKQVEPYNKRNTLVQSLIGQVYFELKEYQKAIEHFNIALNTLDKNNINGKSQVYSARARAYLELNQFNQFQLDMLALLEGDPDNAEALNDLGYEWLERDMNLEQALSFIQKADKITPNKPNILDSLALAYYKNKDYQKALVYAEKAVDELGASSVANMHLGDIYQSLGRTREAQSQYEKALALKLDLTPEIKEQLHKKLSK